MLGGLIVIPTYHQRGYWYAEGMQRFQPPEVSPLTANARFIKKFLEYGLVIALERDIVTWKRIGQ